MMNEDRYRSELRNHFMGNVKNSKIQHALRTQQKLHDYDVAYQEARRGAQNSQSLPPGVVPNQNQHHTSNGSGGDAERLLYDPSFGSQSGDTYRHQSESTSNYMRQLHCKPTKILPALPGNNAAKYQMEDINPYLYESDSNMGGGGPGSEDSAKSQKSSKTVVSKKSSHELRKIVKSQCKLHEVIDESIKQMCNNNERESGGASDERLDTLTSTLSCKRCCDKLHSRSSQKDVMTEIAKGDFLDCRNGDTLTISVDDVVNSKVINPMIRKLQRMYLNNLKEEMSLMEDLERLPHKVNEVYKATIFKQQKD